MRKQISYILIALMFLFSINLINASVLNQTALNYVGSIYVYSTPVYFNKAVYFSDLRTDDATGIIRKLNWSNISQILGSYLTQSLLTNSPLIINDSVYIGDGDDFDYMDGILYKLNETNISQLIDNHYFSGKGGLVSSAFFDDGYIYINTFGNRAFPYFDNINPTLYKLDSSDLDNIINSYTADTNTDFNTQPVKFHGYIFTSGRGGFFKFDNSLNLIEKYPSSIFEYQNKFIYTHGNYLYIDGYQFDYSSISQPISIFVSGAMFSEIKDDHLFSVLTGGNVLYKLNSSNVSQILQSKTTDCQSIVSQPVFSNDFVYVIGNGRICVLNETNISQEIEYDSLLPDERNSARSMSINPLFKNGYLYFATYGDPPLNSGRIYQYHENSTLGLNCGNLICDSGEDFDNCPIDCNISLFVCGNGLVESGEQCDDGNSISSDGCSSSCLIENGYHCVGEPSNCSEIPQGDSGSYEMNLSRKIVDPNDISQGFLPDIFSGLQGFFSMILLPLFIFFILIFSVLIVLAIAYQIKNVSHKMFS